MRRVASFEMTGVGVVKKRRRLAPFEMTGVGVVKKRRWLAALEMTVEWGEELREAGDGEVAGAIARERGAEKAQRDRDKLKMANEKEEERFHREKTRDGGAALSPRTDKE